MHCAIQVWFEQDEDEVEKEMISYLQGINRLSYTNYYRTMQIHGPVVF